MQRHPKTGFQRTVFCTAAGLAVAVGLLACGGQARENQPLQNVSSTLTEDTRLVVQALRLFGAVQIANFPAARGYAGVGELKKIGALDPEWPRLNSSRYQVSCEVSSDREKFVCYADALRAGDPWFRIDDSQVLRAEFGRRPNGSSPVFGAPKSGGMK